MSRGGRGERLSFKRPRGESGQAGIAVIAALLAILAVFGLAVDGASVITTKIGLAGDADGAARAGAGAFDPGVLASTGQAQLDPAAADAAARAYAGSVCSQCTVSTVPGTGAITVTLQRQESTFFLQALGIRDVTVSASSTASPVKP